MHDDLDTNFCGMPLLKFLEQENLYNLARFRTTLDFDREYLRDGSRYAQAKNSVVNHNP